MGKVFERIIIVFLENTMRSSVLQNEYFKHLRKKGIFLPNAQGITHPSQPNYICTIAGDTMGIVDDYPNYVDWYWIESDEDKGTPGYYSYNQPGYSMPSVIDLLEAKNMSWKFYVEDLPKGYIESLTYDMQESPSDNVKTIPDDVFPFVRKHVPVLSFPSIVSNKNRLAKIVDAKRFIEDVNNDSLPHYTFYVPNLINDGHSLSSTQDRVRNYDIDLGPDTRNVDNMQVFVSELLGNDPVAKFPPETLIVLTFDEAYPYPYSYSVYTMLFADFLQANTVDAQPVNLYSLLRTVEDNFGLGSLNRNDVTARPYWFLTN